MPIRLPEREATRILAKQGVKSVPVPVDRIAEALGAAVAHQALSDGEISGMLYRDGVRTVIGVNSNHALKRQRFTIAHEIGHLVLHKGRPVLVDTSVRVNWRDDTSSKASDREEIEANAFAAELLMPQKLVRHEIERLLKKDRKIVDRKLTKVLAEAFDVSVDAMNYRLINLGIQRAG